MALASNDKGIFRTQDAGVATVFGIDALNDFDVAIVRKYSGHPEATVLFSGHKAAKNTDEALLSKLKKFYNAEKLQDFFTFKEAQEDEGVLLMSTGVELHMYVVGPAEKVASKEVVDAVRAAGNELRGELMVLTATMDEQSSESPDENPVTATFNVDKDSKVIFVSVQYCWGRKEIMKSLKLGYFPPFQKNHWNYIFLDFWLDFDSIFSPYMQVGIVSTAGSMRYDCEVAPEAAIAAEKLIECGRAAVAGTAKRIYTSRKHYIIKVFCLSMLL